MSDETKSKELAYLNMYKPVEGEASWGRIPQVKLHRGPVRSAPNFIGQRFGKLTVLELAGHKRNEYLWKCICDCGKMLEIDATSTRLRHGRVKSCGCLKSEEWNGPLGENHAAWTGYKEIPGATWTRIKRGASIRKLSFNLTIEDGWDLFIKQERKCALSGVEIYFSPRSNEAGTASFDRKDSLKGYELDNVQWVHKDVNLIKNNFTDLEIIDWAKKIAKHHGG